MKRGKVESRVANLCSAMEAIAPTWAAAEWDNVGLLVGDANWAVRRVLVTIDLTAAVLAEAKRSRCQAIVSYHPPIFRAIKRIITSSTSQEGIAALALTERIAIYSPHTALDAAAGGTNDTLADLCDVTDARPFQVSTPPGEAFKLVVFVPRANVETVADAMFAAGAGRIGEYEKCSYRVEGYGTFLGGESTQPAVGKKGRLERVAEIRLEVVVPGKALNRVIAAMYGAHPYEEPAFDVYPVRKTSKGSVGQGRMGSLKKSITLGALARRLESKTGASCVQLVGNRTAKVRRAFICAGAAGRLPLEADEPCGRGDVVITGEIRHHDALQYERAGAAAIALGHWASERPVLMPLSRTLKKHLPRVSFVISRADCDPLRGV
jgi:dinuclear metal center YbgI/SA1388 family protein